MTIFYADDDDDDDDLEFFKEAISQIGPLINVVTYANANSLIADLSRDSIFPNLIFLDINMPHMNGIECLAQIKGDTRLAKIPVIMLSTGGSPEEISKCLKLGAKHYFKKQVSISGYVQQLTLIINQAGLLNI